MGEEFAVMLNRILPPHLVAKTRRDSGAYQWGVNIHHVDTGEIANGPEVDKIVSCVIAEMGIRTNTPQVIRNTRRVSE
jgi:hypothetical protein